MRVITIRVITMRVFMNETCRLYRPTTCDCGQTIIIYLLFIYILLLKQHQYNCLFARSSVRPFVRLAVSGLSVRPSVRSSVWPSMVCPSVRLAVNGLSVRPSGRQRSVRPSVRPSCRQRSVRPSGRQRSVCPSVSPFVLLFYEYLHKTKIQNSSVNTEFPPIIKS